MTDREYLDLLKKEMIPAMGCTEPGASALAGAKAAELLEEEVIRAEVYASRDMVKNAMGVGIPGCDLKGILIAVALGIVKKDTSLGLSILSDIDSEHIEKARNINVNLNLVENVPPLYIRVEVFGANHSAVAVVANEHDKFAFLQKDDKVLQDLQIIACGVQPDKEDSPLINTKIVDIVDFANRIDVAELDFVKDAIDINMRISEHSLKNDYGLKVGKTQLETVESVSDLSSAFKVAACYAAAGSDARMSGCNMNVIINSGSGNQGITVTVPVQVLGTYLKVCREKILRAVCISELVGLTLTAKKNRLSALCGAFTAAIGTACAYVYLLGGNTDAMDRAINTMVGNLSGIICDGAKTTCALKIYSCLEASALAVTLAVKGIGPGKESGIVGDNSFETISYLSQISSEGMKETDRTILSIMMEKKK